MGVVKWSGEMAILPKGTQTYQVLKPFSKTWRQTRTYDSTIAVQLRACAAVEKQHYMNACSCRTVEFTKASCAAAEGLFSDVGVFQA